MDELKLLEEEKREISLMTMQHQQEVLNLKTHLENEKLAHQETKNRLNSLEEEMENHMRMKRQLNDLLQQLKETREEYKRMDDRYVLVSSGLSFVCSVVWNFSPIKSGSFPHSRNFTWSKELKLPFPSHISWKA